MASKEMRNWDAGDFGRMFQRASEVTTDESLKSGFSTLGRTLSSLESEFCQETAACGARLASTMDEVHSIGRRMEYCEYPRKFAKDCDVLPGDIERAITDVEALQKQCFL